MQYKHHQHLKVNSLKPNASTALKTSYVSTVVKQDMLSLITLKKTINWATFLREKSSWGRTSSIYPGNNWKFCFKFPSLRPSICSIVHYNLSTYLITVLSCAPLDPLGSTRIPTGLNNKSICTGKDWTKDLSASHDSSQFTTKPNWCIYVIELIVHVFIVQLSCLYYIILHFSP